MPVLLDFADNLDPGLSANQLGIGGQTADWQNRQDDRYRPTARPLTCAGTARFVRFQRMELLFRYVYGREESDTGGRFFGEPEPMLDRLFYRRREIAQIKPFFLRQIDADQQAAENDTAFSDPEKVKRWGKDTKQAASGRLGRRRESAARRQLTLPSLSLLRRPPRDRTWFIQVGNVEGLAERPVAAASTPPSWAALRFSKNVPLPKHDCRCSRYWSYRNRSLRDGI